MDERMTKKNIYNAAIFLFNTKGFSGTSVREIAKQANVNSALISYYFKSKQGLLESLMETFYDGYVEKIEQAFERSELLPIRSCLHKAILSLLRYQQENNQLARFVHRETTIDSTLTREVMTVYLRKEKYYWQKIFEQGFRTGELHKRNIDLTIIQLKGMITMPFSNPQYVQEIFHLSPFEDYFIRQYGLHVLSWLDERFCRQKGATKKEQQKAEVG